MEFFVIGISAGMGTGTGRGTGTGTGLVPIDTGAGTKSGIGTGIGIFTMSPSSFSGNNSKQNTEIIKTSLILISSEWAKFIREVFSAVLSKKAVTAFFDF